MVGQPILIISFDDSRKLKLNKDELEKILMKPQEGIPQGGLPIAVLSVVGGFRTGKSFLLSCFIRYLNLNKAGLNKQLFDSDNDDESLFNGGFKWRSGSLPETQGIWAWSEIFVVNDPSGEKVGVLLIDTQGLFDGNNTLKQNSNIFTLSTLMSSIQIFNLSHKMQEDNLGNLQLFAEFGRLALSKGTANNGSKNKLIKPFQRIVFLIRDWPYPMEHPYGSQGGEAHLKKYLSIPEEMEGTELSERRRHIHECFSQVECYLMPYPGEKVANDGGNFDGRPSEMKVVFRDHLAILTSFLFADEAIQPKIIAGTQSLTTNDFADCIESYVNLLNSDDALSPLSLFEATAKVRNNVLARDALKEYMSYVDSVTAGSIPDGSFLDDLDIALKHEGFKKKTLEHFVKQQMGDSESNSYILDQLNKDIDDTFQHWKSRNERIKAEMMNWNESALKNAKIMYSTAMDDFFKSNLTIPFFTASQLNDQHQKTQLCTMNHLKSQWKGPDDFTMPFVVQLRTCIQDHFISYIIPTNESKKKQEEDRLEIIKVNKLHEDERVKVEEARRLAQEAESRRREAERVSREKAAEVESERRASEAKLKRQAEEAETRRHATEIEAVKQAAEAVKRAAEAENRRQADIAQHQLEVQRINSIHAIEMARREPQPSRRRRGGLLGFLFGG